MRLLESDIVLNLAVAVLVPPIQAIPILPTMEGLQYLPQERGQAQVVGLAVMVQLVA